MKLNGGGIVLTLIWLGFMFLIFVSRQNEYIIEPRQTMYMTKIDTTVTCNEEGCMYLPVCITSECYKELFEEE